MEKKDEIINKIFGVLGYDLYDTFIKIHLESRKKRIEFKLENEIELKRIIIENENITFEQKMLLNSLIGKNLKNLKNQLDILHIAYDNWDEDVNVNNLSEDWLLDFFDKSSKITEKSTQLVWGKLLSCAAADRNIGSKTLLNSLFLMGTDEIKDFLNICQNTISEMGVGYVSDRITAHPIIFFSKNVETYNKNKISLLRLHKLQTLGLVELDLKDEYIFSKNSVTLIYSNKKIVVESNKKIKIGNVRFTYEGFLLYQMSEKIYNKNVLYYIIEIWERRGYDVYLNDKKIN